MDRSFAEEMYKEHILDLYKHPHNFGVIDNPTHKHVGHNPLCGDEITMQLIIKNEVVEDVKFNGKGCAIHMAAASLLTDEIKGKKVEEVKKMSSQDMLNMLMIPISPGRLKCALLSYESLQNSFKDNNK
ncbi:MAG: Fe-S cluster assembly sulfur transfer protein SufU [Candidatus Woesearchaeota archaeon]